MFKLLQRELSSIRIRDSIRVVQLIEAYKSHGHLIAKIDPLNLTYADPTRAPYYLQGRYLFLMINYLIHSEH